MVNCWFTEKIGKFFLLSIFAPLAFSGCFSPWKGNEATLTLLFGGSPGSRAVVPDDVVHIIELDGPTGRQSHTIEGNTFSATVMPGHWEIRIQALKDGILYAEGEGDADIIAGRNNTVAIQMSLTGSQTVYGNAGININFLLENDELILDHDGFNSEGIIISTINNSIDINAIPSFTARVNDDIFSNDNVRWFIWENLISKKQSITIEAKDYNPGTYRLSVRVDINGVPYSTAITFEVADWIGIRDTAQLKAIGEGETAGRKYRLLASVTITEPIGIPNNPFKGEFDGNGKTITLDAIIEKSIDGFVAGLFGVIDTAGIVKNLNLAGSIIATGRGTGTFAGSVAGRNSGKIQNVVSSVNITLISGTSEAVTAGGDIYDFPEGIVGYNSGEITGCIYVGNITEGE